MSKQKHRKLSDTADELKLKKPSGLSDVWKSLHRADKYARKMAEKLEARLRKRSISTPAQVHRPVFVARSPQSPHTAHTTEHRKASYFSGPHSHTGPSRASYPDPVTKSYLLARLGSHASTVHPDNERFTVPTEDGVLSRRVVTGQRSRVATVAAGPDTISLTSEEPLSLHPDATPTASIVAAPADQTSPIARSSGITVDLAPVVIALR